jgi:hypothetical protein
LQWFERIQSSVKGKVGAVIVDVVWRKDDIPSEVEECWAAGSAHKCTLDKNIRAFAGLGLRTIFSKESHEPVWWKAYYEDMGDAKHWQEEWRKYQLHQGYIGLGLFVIERFDT